MVLQSEIVNFLEIMPVDLHQSQEKKIFEDIQHKYIFLSLNMFLPEEGFHIFMTIFSPPCLYLMSSTIQPLDTVCFERER